MFNIALYLDKFKNLGHKERDLKEALVLAVKKIINIDINIKNISLNQGEIIIKESSNIKNSIYIKKKYILEEIEHILCQKINNTNIR